MLVQCVIGELHLQERQRLLHPVASWGRRVRMHVCSTRGLRLGLPCYLPLHLLPLHREREEEKSCLCIITAKTQKKTMVFIISRSKGLFKVSKVKSHFLKCVANRIFSYRALSALSWTPLFPSVSQKWYLWPNGPQQLMREPLSARMVDCSSFSRCEWGGMLIDWASSREHTNRKQWKALKCSVDSPERTGPCLAADCVCWAQSTASKTMLANQNIKSLITKWACWAWTGGVIETAVVVIHLLLPYIWSCPQEPCPPSPHNSQKGGAQRHWCCSEETFSWKTESWRWVISSCTMCILNTNILFQTFCRQTFLLQPHNVTKAYTLPSMLCYDHLCSYFVERFPEIRVLQSHPDAALLVWVSCWRGHVSAQFGVCIRKITAQR